MGSEASNSLGAELGGIRPAAVTKSMSSVSRDTKKSQEAVTTNTGNEDQVEAEPRAGSKISEPAGTGFHLGSLGTLFKFTQAAVNKADKPLPCLPIVAKKPRLAWLEELDKNGYEALLSVNMETLSSQAGYEQS